MTMNKVTIPTILAATILVAGIFAFMPIEQASSVHTTILAGGYGYGCVTEAFTVPATYDGDTTTLTFTNEGADIYITYFSADVTTGGAANEGFGITSATADGSVTSLALQDAGVDAPDDTEREMLSGGGFGGGIYVQSTLAMLVDDNEGAQDIDENDVITFEVCGLVSDPANFGGEDIAATNAPA